MISSSSDPKRVPASELLESAEELYEHAPCGYLTTSPEGRILKVNRTLCEWLGYESEELVDAKRLTDLFTVGGRMFYETHLSLLIRMQKSVDEIALDFLCKNGRMLPTLVNARQKRDESGEPILNRFTIFNASERRAYERELLAARDLFQTTLVSIGDGVITVDAESRVTFMNPEAERICEWTNVEAAGRRIEDVVKLSAEESGEHVENPAVRALRAKSVVGLANHTVLVRRNGTEIAIDDSAAPIRDANGNVTGAVLIFRDISARRKAEKVVAEVHVELEKKSVELQRSNDDLSQFAHMASHDLRSPLNTIVQFTQLLERRHGAEFGDAKQILDHITGAARRMAAVINDLLDYAIATKDGSQVPAATDAGLSVRAAISNLESLIAGSGATVTYDRLPVVPINETSLTQVFQNLIANAIHYRSAAAPVVHVSARETAEDWVFSCRDNGLGIAPEYHRKIFEAFQRLHGVERPGTGIGLAVCKRVLERYHGSIWVESQANQGSTFYFTLPKTA